MKQLIQIGLVSNLLLSTSSFALNPVQGFYAGLLAGGSHGRSSQTIVFTHDHTVFTGKESYSILGGGAGGVLGYKWGHFRLEGEGFYNHISTGPLQVGSCTLQSPDVVTPTGLCTEDNFAANSIGFDGSSAATLGFFNIYYDLFSYDGQTNLVPYIGIGIGEAVVKDGINFINTVTTYSEGRTLNSSGNAAQGILGISYYMDDFTWVGMDYRYITTKKLPHIDNKPYTLNAIDFNVNFAFDKGGID